MNVQSAKSLGRIFGLGFLEVWERCQEQKRQRKETEEEEEEEEAEKKDKEEVKVEEVVVFREEQIWNRHAARCFC